ncbi:MAG: uridine kinase [Candidatus Altiarchaeota archaeon]|nr:uridine kinase [Candidatus Altiarchaeota archaeon]
MDGIQEGQIQIGRGLRRTHIMSRFTRESLLDKKVLDSTHSEKEYRMLPKLNVVSLGGSSIIDRGSEVLFPLLREIVKNRKKHQIMVGCGGGARTRHVYHIGLDLGLPPGALAQLAGSNDEQNTTIIQCLLAPHGGIFVNKERFIELPMYLNAGLIPVVVQNPPYHYWVPMPKLGNIPEHGGDFGMYIISETFGARSMIYLKDQKGLYTENPMVNPRAELIKKIEVNELIKMDLKDLIIERPVLEMLKNSRNRKSVQIINGLTEGNLTKALNGKNVGTIIYKR